MHATGSPPQMRGKATFHISSIYRTRITPADAGKSVIIKELFKVFKDHPRRCGEKFGHSELQYFTAGSPPQMRGKAFFSFFCSFLSRITPADAGKRIWASTLSTGIMDHPRRCGEKLSLLPFCELL